MTRTYIQNRAGSNDIVVHRPWTEEQLEEAVRLRRLGFSSASIARRMKRTRNSVVSKLHQVGEPGRLVNQHGRGFWARHVS